jgi:uncharacterized protein (TIGR02246 family)
MTTELDGFELTSIAEKQTELYVRAFNSGDADAVNKLYTEDAVTVWEPGNPVSGQQRKDQLVQFLAQKPVMAAKVRHAYVTEDTALQVVDWTIDVTGEDGSQQHLSGVGLDVLVHDADGNWRYAVDNPFGEDS